MAWLGLGLGRHAPGLAWVPKKILWLGLAWVYPACPVPNSLHTYRRLYFTIGRRQGASIWLSITKKTYVCCNSHFIEINLGAGKAVVTCLYLARLVLQNCHGIVVI